MQHSISGKIKNQLFDLIVKGQSHSTDLTLI
jgi:hypothetical protein